MSTTRHHHLDVKKPVQNPWFLQLGSSNWTPTLVAYYLYYPSISIRVCLKMGDTPMYGYEAMGKWEQMMEWSSTATRTHYVALRSTKRVPRNATASTAVRKLKKPKLPLQLCCGWCDGLWVGMGRTPKKELKGTQRTSVECWEKKYDYLR